MTKCALIDACSGKKQKTKHKLVLTASKHLQRSHEIKTLGQVFSVAVEHLIIPFYSGDLINNSHCLRLVTCRMKPITQNAHEDSRLTRGYLL